MAIYILSPARATTGGPEALHQLAHMLRAIGKEAYLTYIPNFSSINPEYLEYSVPIAEQIEDSPLNSIIVPEAPPYLGILQRFNHIKKYIWWLSVDNRDLAFDDFHKTNITHLAQSEYAAQFLKEKGCKNLYYLGEYIRESFLNKKIFTPKLDQIAYNPKKGLEFTDLFIKTFKDLKFVPIDNMSQHEVKKTLELSKIYIDFGHHPGQDRLVREAAICGCAVITGKRGSSSYYKDVPIEGQYKFDGTYPGEVDLNLLYKTIKNVYEYFDSHIVNFDNLVSLIEGQKLTMRRQVEFIFNKKIALSDLNLK